jgi:hypothetical protein
VVIDREPEVVLCVRRLALKCDVCDLDLTELFKLVCERAQKCWHIALAWPARVRYRKMKGGPVVPWVAVRHAVKYGFASVGDACPTDLVLGGTS